MPQFKITKTDSRTKLDNNPKTEDKLYILKETNTLGRLFFNYKDGTRIEIGSSDNIYKCTQSITNDTVSISINYLQKYLSNDKMSTVDINEIQINSLVTTEKSLYNIRDIDRTGKKVTLRRIYTQQDLTWNDYY